VCIDHCGHVPQVERPEETNQLLLGFFAEAEQNGRARVIDAGRTREAA
jgi:hypothetical protein